MIGVVVVEVMAAGVSMSISMRLSMSMSMSRVMCRRSIGGGRRDRAVGIIRVPKA